MERTITINIYDLAARFGLDKFDATLFFQHVEACARADGYHVKLDRALNVDRESEAYISQCFQTFCPAAAHPAVTLDMRLDAKWFPGEFLYAVLKTDAVLRLPSGKRFGV